METIDKVQKQPEYKCECVGPTCTEDKMNCPKATVCCGTCTYHAYCKYQSYHN